MSPQHSVITRFLALTDHSESARTITFGIVVFVVVFGIDVLGRFLGLSWYWERLACNALEAVILTLIASHLLRLREERILRREREIGYLNHHIRNSLALIEMAEQQVKDMEQRGSVVHRASRRICRVLEQLSRNEDVSIDTEIPGSFEGGTNSASRSRSPCGF
jgi:hypothetical protein